MSIELRNRSLFMSLFCLHGKDGKHRDFLAMSKSTNINQYKILRWYFTFITSFLVEQLIYSQAISGICCSTAHSENNG